MLASNFPATALDEEYISVSPPSQYSNKKRLLCQNCMSKSLPCNYFISYNIKYMCRITQFSSDAQSCLTLCDHIDCRTPGFLVHHQLPELAQTHVHQVSDAIQPSHPLSFPSAFNLSQHRVFSSKSALHIRRPK